MAALYPLRFEPIFKERLWGGHYLERVHGMRPGDEPIGESWEISDREGAVSIIANGPLAGRSLRWLLESRKDDVLGRARTRGGRFPLLVKIIDAQQPLSLQVHPTAGAAAELNGEAKTEMWYVAQARPGAELFAGLEPGTTRSEFEARLRDGTVMECVHRIPVASGDAMLVPGGRVHALGGQVVVFEIQQNSDTTFRVFDWNRLDSNGRSRELQIEKALRCIDFADFAPGLIGGRAGFSGWKTLADVDAFRIELGAVTESELATGGAFMILGGIAGDFDICWDHSGDSHCPLACGPGVFSLVPACIPAVRLRGNPTARLLLIRPPRQNGS